MLQKTTDVYRQIQWILAVLRSWTASEIFSMLGLDFDVYLLYAGIDEGTIDMYRDDTFDWADLAQAHNFIRPLLGTRIHHIDVS